MTTRTVTIDLKTILDSGWAYGVVSFELVSSVATNGGVVYPTSLQKVQTDSDGIGSVDLSVPDTSVWEYEVRLPSGQETSVSLIAGSTITLASLLEAGSITPVPPLVGVPADDAAWLANAAGEVPDFGRFWVQPQTIVADEIIAIPSDHQMVVFGGLAIDAGGQLIIEAGGALVTPS